MSGETVGIYLEPEVEAFRELLARFLHSYESPNTRRSYARVIDAWVTYRTEGRWFLKSRALTHVKQSDASAYLTALSNKSGAPDEWGPSKSASNTVRHSHHVLRKFYTWLIDEGVASPPNPFNVTLSIQESVKRTYERLTDEQVQRLLKLSDITTVEGRRDHAMMGLLFGVGLRRSEVSRVAIGDVVESNGLTRLRIRKQKNKKLSSVLCPIWTGDALIACKTDRIKEGASDSAPLFVKKDGPYSSAKPAISEWFVYRLFKDYCARASVPERFTPHCARATAVTKWLEEGMTYEQIRTISRHSSARMVEVYDKRRHEDEDHPILKIDYARGTKNS